MPALVLVVLLPVQLPAKVLGKQQMFGPLLPDEVPSFFSQLHFSEITPDILETFLDCVIGQKLVVNC